MDTEGWDAPPACERTRSMGDLMMDTTPNAAKAPQRDILRYYIPWPLKNWYHWSDRAADKCNLNTRTVDDGGGR